MGVSWEMLCFGVGSEVIHLYLLHSDHLHLPLDKEVTHSEVHSQMENGRVCVLPYVRDLG